MAAQWTKLTYPTNPEVPLVGELILLPYPIGLIPFKYGPASSVVSSANQSHVYSTVSRSSKPRRIRATMHHVLVVGATHDPATGRIELEFLPIMSYSNPPSNVVRAGYSGTWSGERWMYQEASDIARLNHLAVPAVDWSPPPSDPAAPVISFRGWLNSRPAWLALTVVSHDIEVGSMWCRHPGGAVMYEGEVSDLLLFILTGLPRLLHRHKNATTVNTVALPTYHTVWTGIFDTYPFDQQRSIISYELESVTDSDMQRALNGEDGVDPEAFCNLMGWGSEPPQTLEMAYCEAKRRRDEVILEWDEGCRDGVRCGTDVPVVEICLLDVPDVEFGETACLES